MSGKLNDTGKFLVEWLRFERSTGAVDSREKTINVGGAGSVVSAAYEQLRNATEYTQDHLLRQRALRRFFARNLSLVVNRPVDKRIGEEVIIELTQAGYIENDTLPESAIATIYEKTNELYQTYWRVRDAGVDRFKAEQWIQDILSVGVDRILDANTSSHIFSQFAFLHYKETLEPSLFTSNTASDDFENSLYVAVHRSLLKSDLANIRADMIAIHKINQSNTKAFIAFNARVDDLYNSDVADKITRHLVRFGAPLRVFKALLEDKPAMAEVLTERKKTLALIEAQVGAEYSKAQARLNSGLVKSIVFLFLTKALIGLFIEIPYDIIVIGSIAVLPLVINLLFPVVYLLVLRLGLKMPGSANTKAIVSYTDQMLYGSSDQVKLYPRPSTKQYPLIYSLVYGLMFLIAFAVVFNVLLWLNFNFVQGIIFVIFLASASFLGFRLSRIIRELELVTTKAGIVSIVRDFIYLPFIVLGQQLSEKYEKINIVSLILDTVIELPLKTVLRLLRQWSGFISDQKDRL